MATFQRSLLRWYRQNHRSLPWRKTHNPYRILVSEIMLQQTQVHTVIPYYRRWITLFPDLRALARASLGKVLKAWEGLGYYARARNLRRLASDVCRRFAGRLPREESALRSLPGIGRYSAGAVLSIAFHKPVPVVDGNVVRVFSRYFAIQADVTRPGTLKMIWEKAASLVPGKHPGDYNQALMELGATICLPRAPECPRCPLRDTCKARKLGLQYRLPKKGKRKNIPHFNIGAAVIRQGGKILISQRPLQGLLGGLWEFPGGKQEAGETIEQTIRREIKEELGMRVSVDREMIQVRHTYSHFRITLHAYDCHVVSGTPRALEVRAWRWVRPSELRRFAFPKANQPVIDALVGPRKSRSAPAVRG